MEQLNALSLIKRYDGSYYYIIELGQSRGLYKYMLADWQGNHLGKPLIIYSHTKRSSLNTLDKEYFDNNLLSKKRLERYINEHNNLYIGGIERIGNQPTREYREGIIIKKNYKTYIRNSNYILIEFLEDGDLKTYSINEFVNRKTIVDFESNKILTEKDLFNMHEETDYVINNLLKKERVEKKVEIDSGYVGTVILNNGKYSKTSSMTNLDKAKRIS